MKPTRISILGDEYFLYSQSSAELGVEPTAENRAGSVLLSPSLTQDFFVKSYGKDGRVEKYNPAAAVAAAAHLTLVRGLPIQEFNFDTPGGSVEIFCTGNGFFEIEIPKCKVLFTGMVEALGCDVAYADVFAWGVFRVLLCEDISNADRKALQPLVLAGKHLPDALLFSSLSEGKIEILPYFDFNPAPPSRLLLYAAAYLASDKKRGGAFANDGELFLKRDYSSVYMRVKCEIK